MILTSASITSLPLLLASSIFWRSILPIFGQEKYEFSETTAITFFNENSSNQFYMHLCVQIFNQFLLLLFKLLLKYILIQNLKKHLLRTSTYMRTKLPIMAVQNSQIDYASRSKQSNFKYTKVVLL